MKQIKILDLRKVARISSLLDAALVTVGPLFKSLGPTSNYYQMGGFGSVRALKLWDHAWNFGGLRRVHDGYCSTGSDNGVNQ